jgi:tetratricopeptide (TPR) repeat protein
LLAAQQSDARFTIQPLLSRNGEAFAGGCTSEKYTASRSDRYTGACGRFTRALSEEDWLTAQQSLASAYLIDGQNTKAIEILERIVKVREEELREDHPRRLSSQHILAGAYQANGQNIKAIEILEQVVKVREEKLQEDHPARLASQHILAGAYQANGQNIKAIEILEGVVKVEEKLREDHPDRLSSQHVLAYTYWNDGQTEKALEIQEYVVTVARRGFRADHTDRIVMEKHLSYMLNKTRKECIQNEVQPVRTQASPSRTTRSPEREGSH